MKQAKLRKQVCYLFTAANGNSLFLPAAGYRDEYYLYHAGSSGFYRSSSLYTHDPYEAWRYDYDYGMSDYDRCCGYSVRPVRSARQN